MRWPGVILSMIFLQAVSAGCWNCLKNSVLDPNNECQNLLSRWHVTLTKARSTLCERIAGYDQVLSLLDDFLVQLAWSQSTQRKLGEEQRKPFGRRLEKHLNDEELKTFGEILESYLNSLQYIVTQRFKRSCAKLLLKPSYAHLVLDTNLHEMRPFIHISLCQYIGHEEQLEALVLADRIFSLEFDLQEEMRLRFLGLIEVVPQIGRWTLKVTKVPLQPLNAAELGALFFNPSHQLVMKGLGSLLVNARRFNPHAVDLHQSIKYVQQIRSPANYLCIDLLSFFYDYPMDADLTRLCMNQAMTTERFYILFSYFDQLQFHKTKAYVNRNELIEYFFVESDLALDAMNLAVKSYRFGSRSSGFASILAVLRHTSRPSTVECVQYFADEGIQFEDVRFAWMCVENPGLLLSNPYEWASKQNHNADSLLDLFPSNDLRLHIEDCLNFFSRFPWVLAVCSFLESSFSYPAMRTIGINRLQFDRSIEYSHMKVAASFTRQSQLDCVAFCTNLLSLSVIKHCEEQRSPQQESMYPVISHVLKTASPVSIDQMEITKKQSIPETDLQTRENEDPLQCPICLDAIEDKDLVEWPFCTHELDSFCMKRIKDDAESRHILPSCPLCRRIDTSSLRRP